MSDTTRQYLTIRGDDLSDGARAVLEAGDPIDDATLAELKRVGERVQDPEAHLAEAGVEGWYLDEDGHSYYVPADSELHEVVQIMRDYGDFAHGGEPVATAREWIDHDVAHAARAWLEAGVFDAAAAAALRRVGLMPADVAIDYEHAAQIGTLGYWVANRDISAERAAEIVAGTEATA